MSAHLKVQDRQQTIKAMNFIGGKWEFGEEKVYRRLNPADTSDVVADAPILRPRLRSAPSKAQRKAGTSGAR